MEPLFVIGIISFFIYMILFNLILFKYYLIIIVIY